MDQSPRTGRGMAHDWLKVPFCSIWVVSNALENGDANQSGVHVPPNAVIGLLLTRIKKDIKQLVINSILSFLLWNKIENNENISTKNSIGFLFLFLYLRNSLGQSKANQMLRSAH